MIEFTWPITDIANEFTKIPAADMQGDTKRKYVFNANWGSASASLNRLHNTFQKNKNLIIDKLLESDNNHWYMSFHRNKLYENLKLSVWPQIDQTGFQMGWHLDHRLIFANGVLNISENESNTDFSIDCTENSIYYTLPGSAGTGVFWLATENNHHRVRPFTRDRYIIMFTLSFYEI